MSWERAVWSREYGEGLPNIGVLRIATSLCSECQYSGILLNLYDRETSVVVGCFFYYEIIPIHNW
jgi:hypothetical protein